MPSAASWSPRRWRRPRCARVADQLGDYKLYTLVEPTTVAAQQTKQIRFLHQTGGEVREGSTSSAADAGRRRPIGEIGRTRRPSLLRLREQDRERPRAAAAGRAWSRCASRKARRRARAASSASTACATCRWASRSSWRSARRPTSQVRGAWSSDRDRRPGRARRRPPGAGHPHQRQARAGDGRAAPGRRSATGFKVVAESRPAHPKNGDDVWRVTRAGQRHGDAELHGRGALARLPARPPLRHRGARPHRRTRSRARRSAGRLHRRRVPTVGMAATSAASDAAPVRRGPGADQNGMMLRCRE